MKKNTLKITSFLFFSFVFLFTACKKDYPEVSKATYWPEIKINGNELITLIVNNSYSDAGATVTSGGTPIDYTTDNPVDTAQAGVYKVVYSATNTDGITVSKSRTVIVLPGVVTNDVAYIEGKYETVPNGGTPATTFSNIEKIAPGVYHTENCWGNGSLAVIPAYFFCLDGVSLEVPLQNAGAAQVSTTEPGTYDVATGHINWTIIRPLFQPGGLIRVKDWFKR
ncbi:MAG: DUF5011 domain-containing protein [Chitinophagales bacterium]